MDAVPEVRYARSGQINIAYTRWGEGPEVIVYSPPLVSNVELMWEIPEWARAARYAGGHAEMIMIDKRGVGLSDRDAEPPSLEDRIADTMSVIETEGLDRFHVIGQSEGGTIAIAMAARYPERVRSLVVSGAAIPGADHGDLAALADEDNPLPGPDEVAEMFRTMIRNWGSASSENLRLLAPSVADDPRVRRSFQRFERQSASPAAIRGFLRSLHVDVTPYLGRITVPTLVMHCLGDRLVHPAHGRYAASRIAGAVLREYECEDHVWQLSARFREIQDDIVEFVTGSRPGVAASQFAVVLFTDIVDSTVRESAAGDSGWRVHLEAHDRTARDVVARHRGHIVKYTGDGLLVTFAEPHAAVASAAQFVAEMDRAGLPVRAGLHAGAVEVREDGDVCGITVNIAARVQAVAAAGELLVSRTVRDLLLGTDVRFDDRGDHELKGLDGTWRLYAAAT